MRGYLTGGLRVLTWTVPRRVANSNAARIGKVTVDNVAMLLARIVPHKVAGQSAGDKAGWSCHRALACFR